MAIEESKVEVIRLSGATSGSRRVLCGEVTSDPTFMQKMFPWCKGTTYEMPAMLRQQTVERMGTWSSWR